MWDAGGTAAQWLLLPSSPRGHPPCPLAASWCHCLCNMFCFKVSSSRCFAPWVDCAEALIDGRVANVFSQQADPISQLIPTSWTSRQLQSQKCPRCWELIDNLWISRKSLLFYRLKVANWLLISDLFAFPCTRANDNVSCSIKHGFDERREFGTMRR